VKLNALLSFSQGFAQNPIKVTSYFKQPQGISYFTIVKKVQMNPIYQ